MAKPTSKPAWNPPGAKVIEPNPAKKLVGFDPLERPASQYFNFFWKNVSDWIDYLDISNDYNIIIDSTYGDYATIQDYIADIPVPGDRLLITESQTIIALLSIPSNISIRMFKDSIINCATDLATAIEFGDNVTIEGELILSLAHGGTITKAFSFNGDSGRMENLILDNSGGNIVTNGFYIEAGKNSNFAAGEAYGGTITNVLVDNSGLVNNLVCVREK